MHISITAAAPLLQVRPKLASVFLMGETILRWRCWKPRKHDSFGIKNEDDEDVWFVALIKTCQCRSVFVRSWTPLIREWTLYAAAVLRRVVIFHVFTIW